MSTSRTTGGDDSIRVDTEVSTVRTHPADGALGIHDTGVRQNSVTALDPVIRPHGNHAARGQGLCLRFELLDLAARPASSEEEDDGRPRVAAFPIRRKVKVSLQLNFAHRFVGDLP